MRSLVVDQSYNLKAFLKEVKSIQRNFTEGKGTECLPNSTSVKVQSGKKKVLTEERNIMT